ncbi:ABC transporter substrate-binding protein [Pokkaliibacter sp. MBI-7]|uniref:ABC transporter substrate-binding protein n=1 Tax=Pokkaliibacter sp. MBI-7 TaxID=3040600 RepID=UPI00244C64CA|nr:ABC transporter substrate-binding protein [Pokkaliibacter sp. MBI-7]MDH2432516.1 ABC transporter substrate-binding protein [Pokkaliibacter sp. MBI-7]
MSRQHIKQGRKSSGGNLRVRSVMLAAALLGGLLSEVSARTLNVVGPWEMTGIEPSQSGYVFTRMQVAETLTGADSQGHIVPQLATAWQVSEDGLRWQFQLREGVTFHDGTPLTAAIVAAELQRAHQGAGVLKQVPVKTIRAEGSQLVIELERVFAPLPAFLANYSTLILAPSSYTADGKVSQIIATGPYQIEAMTLPLKLELRRNEHWWGGKVAIDSASYLAVGKGETRALMAQSGEADLVFSLLPVSLAALSHDPRLHTEVVTLPRTRMLKLNAGSPLFSDVRVRQALSLALDRQGMAKAILRNDKVAANQLFSPAMGAWHDSQLAPIPRDLDKARGLLAEAGWQAGADGILQKDGQPFQVKLLTYSNLPELPVLATAIQAQLREVGIAVEVAVGNSSEIVSQHRDGVLQMALFARNFSLVPNPLGTLLQDYGPEGGDWGAMGWSDAQMQSSLQQLQVITDAAQQAPLQQQINQTLQQQLPVIPVAWSELAVAASRQLEGLQVDPYELSYHLTGLRWKSGE